MSAFGPGLIVTQANVDAMKLSFEKEGDTCVSLEHIIEGALFLVSPAGDGLNGVFLRVQAKGI